MLLQSNHSNLRRLLAGIAVATLVTYGCNGSNETEPGPTDDDGGATATSGGPGGGGQGAGGSGGGGSDNPGGGGPTTVVEPDPAGDFIDENCTAVPGGASEGDIDEIEVSVTPDGGVNKYTLRARVSFVLPLADSNVPGQLTWLNCNFGYRSDGSAACGLSAPKTIADLVLIDQCDFGPTFDETGRVVIDGTLNGLGSAAGSCSVDNGDLIYEATGFELVTGLGVSGSCLPPDLTLEVVCSHSLSGVTASDEATPVTLPGLGDVTTNSQ